MDAVRGRRYVAPVSDRSISGSSVKNARREYLNDTKDKSRVDVREDARARSDLDGERPMRARTRRRPRAARSAPPAAPHAGSVDIGQSPAARGSDGPDEDHRVRARGAMTTSAHVGAERQVHLNLKCENLSRSPSRTPPCSRPRSPHPRRVWSCASDWSRALI